MGAMVHRHAPDKLMQRRQRAVDRGYIRPAPAGARLLAVPAALHAPGAAMARSAERHRDCDAFSGGIHRFARDAALFAQTRGVTDSEQLRRDSTLHRAANRAKHRVRHEAEDQHSPHSDVVWDTWAARMAQAQPCAPRVS